MKIRVRHPRKLLTASLGVAAVSYVACGSEVVANLVVAPSDAGAAGADATNQLDVVANLVVAPSDVATSDRPSSLDVVANLVVAPSDADTAKDGSTDGGPADSRAQDAPLRLLDVVANLVIAPRDANGQ